METPIRSMKLDTAWFFKQVGHTFLDTRSDNRFSSLRTDRFQILSLTVIIF